MFSPDPPLKGHFLPNGWGTTSSSSALHGCTAAGRAVLMCKTHPPPFIVLHTHHVPFIDGLCNATAAPGMLCPHPIFNSQTLCPSFPELKAQASLLPELGGFCNLHLEFKAMNPSPDDFLMDTEELWAVHPSALTLLTWAHFSHTRVQHISWRQPPAGFSRGRNIFKRSFGMSQVFLHKCRMLQAGSRFDSKGMMEAEGLMELVVKYH